MGGSNKQTTTSTNAPYKAAQPLLDKGMGDALDLYNGPGLVQPNTMSTVVPFSQQTTQGMGALQGLAGQNMGSNGLSGQLQGIINGGGLNADQNTALEGIRNTATGSFDINADPGFQQVFDKTRDAVNQNAAGLGRYASGTHDGVMTRELGDLGARQFQDFQSRKDAAQQQLFNAGQTAQGNLGSAYDGMKAPISDLMGVGSMNEDLYGRTLNDQLRIAQERQNAPLANLQALMAAANGSGSYGTTTQQAQGPNNTFSNIAGAGLGAASLGTNGGAKL
ncbi:hypothetical protein ASD64_01285 [Mesorhizobium sp. Root157]|uniref:hypothetical protein n=1 Tax=Mesorhizobium sp. Root157 TaxID=1736477 RepID=UPI0006F1C8F6|nr:hypothetical protein [Mesorhizobium sp. Root157]KRA00236.1 hypothetical protein ASD64_01285 [Mesorhizobium sp. Root157]